MGPVGPGAIVPADHGALGDLAGLALRADAVAVYGTGRLHRRETSVYDPAHVHIGDLPIDGIDNAPDITRAAPLVKSPVMGDRALGHGHVIYSIAVRPLGGRIIPRSAKGRMRIWLRVCGCRRAPSNFHRR